jgi:5-methylthioadenosine/S-adenosylhomocysteine deaminase
MTTATAGAGMVAAGELVVAGEVVLTADPARRSLEPGWVTIDSARGTITGVEAGRPPAGVDAIHGDVVIPGMVSAHQHLVDLLVRGGPIGPTFLDWLLGTYHAGLAHARPDECAAAVATVRAAGLAAGVTTVVDCWSVGPVDDPQRTLACAQASVEAHLASGGRTLFAPMFVELVPQGWSGAYGIDPARLCRPVEESLDMVRSLGEQFGGQSGGDRLTVTPSPELPEAATADGLRRAHALAAELGAVMPMHFCPSPPSRDAFGPDEGAAVGILGPRLLAAHCGAVDDRDIRMIGQAGVHVAHCPNASRALGRSMLTPLAALRRAGSIGGLGLDNASLHATSDLFAEARQAAIIARGQDDALAAEELFELLTIEGARAAGLDARAGSLEVGKQADLVVLDASRAHWWPRSSSWAAAVVSCARADDVTTVLVDGRVVAAGGVATTSGDHAAVDVAAKRIRALRGW